MPFFIDGVTATPEQEATLVAALNELGLTATQISGTALELVEAVSARVLPLAYIDFSDKPDGRAPLVLDSGQGVDDTFNATGRYPVVANGRLVISGRPASGGLADYYQSNLDAPVIRVGAEWVMPAGTPTEEGNITYAAWNGYYEGGGTNVPRSWIHMSIVPGTGTTGTAMWFVCNGTGELRAVKSQTFTNPAADGVTKWRSEAVLDLADGKGYARLPDGSIMTLTDEEIATFLTAVSVPVFTFADMSSTVIMCEHYANADANTAKFCEFTALWGDTDASLPKPWESKTLTLLDELKSFRQTLDAVPPVTSGTVYAPAATVTVNAPTGMANIDTTYGKVTFKAGPSGSVLIHASAYYEWSGAENLYWRLAGSAGTTAIQSVGRGVNGQYGKHSTWFLITELTPFASYNQTLQHALVATPNLATCKIGGAGGSIYPALTLVAIPI